MREEVCWHFKPSESKPFCQRASPPALITMKQQLPAKCLRTAHTDKREQSDIKITRFTQKHPETTVSSNTVYKKFKVPEKM